MAQIAFRGNASKSPEMKFFDDGTAIAKASIAENHWRQNRQTNEWEQTGTTWWNVVVRGKNAERFAQNVDKGTRLVIFGRVTSRSYEKDGEKRSFTEVSVDSFGFDNLPDQAPAQGGGNQGGYDDPPF